MDIIRIRPSIDKYINTDGYSYSDYLSETRFRLAEDSIYIYGKGSSSMRVNFDKLYVLAHYVLRLADICEYMYRYNKRFISLNSSIYQKEDGVIMGYVYGIHTDGITTNYINPVTFVHIALFLQDINKGIIGIPNLQTYIRTKKLTQGIEKGLKELDRILTKMFIDGGLPPLEPINMLEYKKLDIPRIAKNNLFRMRKIKEAI